jgi:hypothetical protein
MKKGTTYGIVSDTYIDVETASNVVSWLKHANIDRLVLNGNLFSSKHVRSKQIHDIRRLLDAAGESGIDTLITPGGIEGIVEYGQNVKEFCNNYKNLKDTLHEKHQYLDDHESLFIAGSPNFDNGEFYFAENIPAKTGLYVREGASLIKYQRDPNLLEKIEDNPDWSLIYVNNIAEFDEKIKSPENTLIFCSYPAKFETESGLDFRHVGVDRDGIMHQVSDVI